jgi:hypothetical protein
MNAVINLQVPWQAMNISFSRRCLHYRVCYRRTWQNKTQITQNHGLWNWISMTVRKIAKCNIYFRYLTWFHVSMWNAADVKTQSLDMSNTVKFRWKKLLKKTVLGFKLLLTCLLPATVLLAVLPTHKVFIPGSHFVT